MIRLLTFLVYSLDHHSQQHTAVLLSDTSLSSVLVGLAGNVALVGIFDH